MTDLTTTVQLPDHLLFFYTKRARYKVAYGGRGSAKSHTIARAAILRAREEPLLILCGREIQASINDSVHALLKNIIYEYGFNGVEGKPDEFIVTQTEIRHVNGSKFIFKGLRSNIAEIKSTEGIDICWIEEAAKVSQRSLDDLIPTIRKEGSELWLSFNPDDEMDPVYQMFVVNEMPDSIVVKANYDQNPWFTSVLQKEMEHDRITDKDKYENVWLGNLRNNLEASYYRHQMRTLRERDGLREIMLDPTKPVYTAWDIGYDDYTAIWTFQVIEGRINYLWYDEGCNEYLQYYVNILNERKVKYGFVYDCHFWPHDGKKNDMVLGNRLQKGTQLGLNIQIIRQTPSVQSDIELCKNYFHRLYFNEKTTKQGVRSIERYSREFNEKYNIYKQNPKHDEYSHGADAFRYSINAVDMFILAEEFEEEFMDTRDERNSITGY